MPSNKNEFQTRILFDNEAGPQTDLLSRTQFPAPTVFTGERLRGTLVLDHDGDQMPPFDAVQLVLRGKVKNVIEQADGRNREIEKPLVLMSCVKLADDFHKVAVSPSNAVTRSEFLFDIPESITIPTCGSHQKSQLPPSIRVVKMDSSTYELTEHWQQAIAGHCDVTYLIEAHVLKGGKRVYETSREVLVMPTSEIPPPLDPEDLKYEYRLSATSSMSSLWKLKKSVLVTVSSKEPRPVVFTALKGDCVPVNTEVVLDFKTRQMCDGVDGLCEAPVVDCEIIVTLEAITYFLENEKDRMLSLAETRRSSFAISKRKRFKPQRRKLKLAGWKRMENITAPANRTVEWDTTTSLTTLLPEDAPRLPSFFSTLVSRRYAFNLEIVPRTKLGVSTKPMHLRIPVQIVHASFRKHPDGPSDWEVEFGDDLKAPAYVP